jgi:arsenate reductase
LRGIGECVCIAAPGDAGAHASEHCPVFPGAYTYLHWSLDDPAAAVGSDEQKLAVFRTVRDQIASRVRDFVANR